jgi:hypothetical protein
MALPINAWLMIVALAVACSAISIFIKDRMNYIDAICGVLAAILWLISGISWLSGITSDNTTYTAPYLFWVFAAIGIIQAIISVVRILDILTERKKEEHVSFDTIHL